MKDQNNLIKTKIKLYTLIWILFAFELAVFFLITFIYLSPEELQQSKNELNILLLYMSYLLAVISIPAVYKIYDLRKKKVNKDDDIKTKLDKYFYTSLIKYAILETAAIFSLAAFYFNKTNEPLYMFGIVFIAVLLNKPSYKQFEKDFLYNNDDNVIEEIVYMPDEFKKSNDDINSNKSKSK